MLVPLVCLKGLPMAHWGFMSPQVLSSAFCQPASICFSVSQGLDQGSVAKTLGRMGRSTGIDEEEH